MNERLSEKGCMSIESYLNHPTFGLLYRICLLEGDRELFTTLYAQRLFFLVDVSAQNMAIDPITRSEAKLMVENRMRDLRRTGNFEQYKVLQNINKQTF